MTLNQYTVAGVILSVGLGMTSGSALALRPAHDRVAPLCREVETGERCQTRSGDVRIRGSGRRSRVAAAPSGDTHVEPGDVAHAGSQGRSANVPRRPAGQSAQPDSEDD